MKANHKEGRWQGVSIERGQHLTSSDKLANELGITRQQIRTSLNKLKSTSEITIKTTSKYTLVTVANYEVYQFKEEKVTNAITINATNEQPTDNQQITTNKNDKKNKNEKKVFIPPLFSEVEDHVLAKGYVINPKRFFDYYEASEWKKPDGKPVLNWKLTTTTWNNTELEKRPNAVPYEKKLQQEKVLPAHMISFIPEDQDD
jgi:biotin operon repressor